MRDSFQTYDDKLIYSITETNKKDYASKKMKYLLEAGDLSAYEKLMSTLYSEEERTKIEWAIGSIVSGESKKLQKFMVLYGAAGTGKSTVLNIIQQLFDGYYSVFDAKALGSSSNSFALEAFKTNPLEYQSQSQYESLELSHNEVFSYQFQIISCEQNPIFSEVFRFPKHTARGIPSTHHQI